MKVSTSVVWEATTTATFGDPSPLLTTLTGHNVQRFIEAEREPDSRGFHDGGIDSTIVLHSTTPYSTSPAKAFFLLLRAMMDEEIVLASFHVEPTWTFAQVLKSLVRASTDIPPFKQVLWPEDLLRARLFLAKSSGSSPSSRCEVATSSRAGSCYASFGTFVTIQIPVDDSSVQPKPAHNAFSVLMSASRQQATQLKFIYLFIYLFVTAPNSRRASVKGEG